MSYYSTSPGTRTTLLQWGPVTTLYEDARVGLQALKPQLLDERFVEQFGPQATGLLEPE